jgi:transcription elongation factor GreB
MSKAFTRESDDRPERPFSPRPPAALPPGTKNYLTPDGARRLREELDRLIEVERPQIAASGEDSDARRQLQILDQRAAHLRQSLHSAVVVQPPVPPWVQVRFGATVTVRDRRGREERYRIVGADETDIDQGWVSCHSPIARALLNAPVGKRVRFRVPAGEEELEIVEILYEASAGETG